MSVFHSKAYDNHQQVTFCRDQDSGLQAIIAIHDTTLGPAVGGCRMWPYSSDEDALTDALRLSRGMTYKNALAGLNFGGGKSVIIGDSKTDKSPALFHAFGRFIERLGGDYISAEDVGMSTKDIALINETTDYVTGLESKSGDPSPATAHGVFRGIEAAVKHSLGRDDLDGIRVAVQGLGHVGYHLCRSLHQAGAKIFVADIDAKALELVVKECQAKPVDVGQIHALDVDIYAPCALGATINDQTLPQIKATIIAGSANNQLAEDRHGFDLLQRGILYAPDYVINAGGIINVSFDDNYDKQVAMNKVSNIYTTLMEIFETAKADGKPTNVVADGMARRRIADAMRT